MNEIVLEILTLALLLAGFVALVRLARSDAFAGPGLGHRDVDELAGISAPGSD